MDLKRITLWATLASALLGTAGCAASVAGPARPHPAPAAPAADRASFHDALAPYGDWLQVEPWGAVWTPWDIEPGWRPYTHGHWAASTLGWAWASDEPWGWAPFHYGRWTFQAQLGWLWIPDTVWSPAWVAWRAGNGWVGWGPLPPDARWRSGIGLEIHGPDLSLSIVQHGWSFVRQRDFLEPRIWRSLEPLPRHRFLLRETQDRTRYEEVGGRIVVHGIGLDEIERSAGPVRRHRIEDLETKPGEAARRPLPAVRSADQELQRLNAWEQAQRESLDDEQKRERRDWLPGQVSQELVRRQEEERRALGRDVEREKTLATNRRERWVKARERAKEKPQDRREAEKPRR